MRIVVALLGIVLASSVAAKDLTLRQRTAVGPPGAPSREETVYLVGSKVVSDSPVSRTIVDLDAKTITTVDKTKRTYGVVAIDSIGAEMEEMRKQVEMLPPEERKKLGGMFDDVPVTVTPTGKTDTIAGYSASEFALKGGPYAGSVWVTEALPTPSEFKRWKTIEGSMGGLMGAGRRLGEAMSSLNGFPLRSRVETTAHRRVFVVSSEVLEVKEASAPAEALQVPAGFTRHQGVAR